MEGVQVQHTFQLRICCHHHILCHLGRWFRYCSGQSPDRTLQPACMDWTQCRTLLHTGLAVVVAAAVVVLSKQAMATAAEEAS